MVADRKHRLRQQSICSISSSIAISRSATSTGWLGKRSQSRFGHERCMLLRFSSDRAGVQHCFCALSTAAARNVIDFGNRGLVGAAHLISSKPKLAVLAAAKNTLAYGTLVSPLLISRLSIKAESYLAHGDGPGPLPQTGRGRHARFALANRMTGEKCGGTCPVKPRAKIPFALQCVSLSIGGPRIRSNDTKDQTRRYFPRHRRLCSSGIRSSY